MGLSGDASSIVGDEYESKEKEDGESIDGSLVLSGCESSETISMVESSSVGSGLSSSDGSIRLSVGESVW